MKTNQHKDLESESLNSNWVWYLIVVCALIFAALFALGENSGRVATDIAFRSGYYLLHALIVAYAFYKIFGERRSRVWWSSFIAIYGTFIGTGVAIEQYERVKVPSQLQEIVDTTSTAVEEGWAINADGSLGTIETTFSTPAGAEGYVRTMFDAVADLGNDAVTIVNKYSLALNDAGLNEFLAAGRLSNDEGFADSREMLVLFQQAYGVYKTDFETLLSSAPSRIVTLDIPEREKQAFLKSFNTSLEKDKTEYSRNLYLEQQSLNELEKIVDMLELNRARWFVDGDQIMFEADELVNAYNQHLANLDAYVSEQERNQQLILERQREALDNFGM